MIQSFKMVFDANRISTQKIREIIEELTELGVYDSKTGMVSYDNDDKVLEQKIIAILDNIVQNHWFLFLGQTCAKGLTFRPSAQVCLFYIRVTDFVKRLIYKTLLQSLSLSYFVYSANNLIFIKINNN